MGSVHLLVGILCSFSHVTFFIECNSIALYQIVITASVCMFVTLMNEKLWATSMLNNSRTEQSNLSFFSWYYMKFLCHPLVPLHQINCPLPWHPTNLDNIYSLLVASQWWLNCQILILTDTLYSEIPIWKLITATSIDPVLVSRRLHIRSSSYVTPVISSILWCTYHKIIVLLGPSSILCSTSYKISYE